VKKAVSVPNKYQGDVSSDDSGADLGRNSDSDEDAAGIRSDGGIGERDPLDRRETLVCDRLRVVMNALTVLLQANMEGRFMEKLVSSATRVFRAITKVGVGSRNMDATPLVPPPPASSSPVISWLRAYP